MTDGSRMTTTPDGSEPAPQPAPDAPVPPAPTASDPTQLPPPPPGSAAQTQGPAWGAYGAAQQAPEPSSKKKWFKLAGVGAVLAVIAVKIAIGFGIGAAANKIQHDNGDAEAVVQAFMQSNTVKDVKATLADGVGLAKVADQSCLTSYAGDTSTGFRITGSDNVDNSTATVDVELEQSGNEFTFTTVEEAGGWKVKSFACK